MNTTLHVVSRCLLGVDVDATSTVALPELMHIGRKQPRREHFGLTSTEPDKADREAREDDTVDATNTGEDSTAGA